MAIGAETWAVLIGGLSASVVIAAKVIRMIVEVVRTVREIRSALGVGSTDGDLREQVRVLRADILRRIDDHEARIVRTELQMRELDCVADGTSRACREVI